MTITRRALLAGVGLGALGIALAPESEALVAGKRMRSGWVCDSVYSYGHSFTMDKYPYFTAPYRSSYSEYGRKVARDLGVPVDMNGRSGTVLLDTVRAVTAPTFEGSSARQWQPGTANGGKAVLLQNVHNDEASQIGGTAQYRSGYALALRLMLGAFGARSFIPAASNSYETDGAWTSVAYPDRAPGGAMAYTKQYGAKMNFLITGGDTCHIATAACDDADLTYGTMRVEVNGQVVGYYDGTGKMQSYTNSVDDTTIMRWSPAGIRIVGMNDIAGTSGNKTLTLRKVSDDTNPIWVSGVYLTSGTPPKVFVALEPPRNPAATSQGAVAAFQANDANYRALITDLVGEYGYADVVDLAPGWNNATMVATGVDPYNFHPNGAGMDFIASKFRAAILAA